MEIAKHLKKIAIVSISLFCSLNVAGRDGERRVKTFGIIPKRIGGEWLLKEPKAVYAFIAQLGYKEIERNDNYGMTSADCRSFLDGLKLRTVIWGMNTQDILSFAGGKREELDRSIAECKTAGAKYIACYSTTKDYSQTIQGWKDWAALLNRVGEYCAGKGLKLIYHNHAGEFTPIDGVMPYDVLVAALNPKFCNMELDIYWVAKGGADPVAVMKSYPGRFPVLHLKDMSKGEDQYFEDMGYGIIDYLSVFRAAKVAGVKHFIIEHDRPTDSKRSIERGAGFFKNFRY